MSTPPVPWFAVVVLGSAFWAAGINITSLPSSSQLLHLFTLSLGGTSSPRVPLSFRARPRARAAVRPRHLRRVDWR